MDDKVLALSESDRDFMDDQAWEARGWIERMMRDAGMPFTPENTEFAKRFGARMAVHRTMVRAGLILPPVNGSEWEGVL